jgi:DNA-directed RNA polymerase beta' subunit
MQNTKQTTLIKSLKLGIADRDTIITWSHGEIVSPETINYKTGKPV